MITGQSAGAWTAGLCRATSRHSAGTYEAVVVYGYVL